MPNVLLSCLAIVAVFHGCKNIHLTGLISVAVIHKDYKSLNFFCYILGEAGKN